MFSKEKLELMYFLTTQNQFMNPAEAARTFSKYKDISERTVRRWLKFLQKQCFDYFPALHYENLGLKRIFIIIENLRYNNFLLLNPYLNYVYPGTNFQNFRRTMLLGYLIPENHIRDFQEFLLEAKQKGIFESFISFPTKTAVPYSYIPFHQVVKSDGNLQIDDDYEVDYFMSLLAQNINREIDLSVRSYITTNPLIIPILFEYLREHWSSRRVWFNAKNKLGDTIWNYVRSIKKRKTKTDNVGIKLVQDAIKQINQDARKFFLQPRIEYAPLNNKNLILFILLKLKDSSSIIKFCETVAKNTLMTGFCVGYDKKFLGLYIVTNLEKANYILCTLLPSNSNPKFKPKAIWLNKEDAKYYWTSRKHMKFDYSKVFDPKKCEWIYEHDKYMAELRKL